MSDLVTPTTVWSLVFSVLLLLLGALARKYVLPYLQTGRRAHYARYIAILADDLTDDLRARYPEKEWLRHLDEAIDKLIEICGISFDVAARAVNAAAARK